MPPVAIFLLGPTASGKTSASLALARELPVEIISVDSALVYRDMDIGTAKPDCHEQAQCPHHLIDILSPADVFSAADFRTLCLQHIDEIIARGRIPLLVGGTMLYFKVLREGLSVLPQADPQLRRDIDAEAARLGWPAVHARLHKLDPQAAARLAPTDAQRIQRALEIVQLTGKTLAEAQAQRSHSPLVFQALSFALTPSRRERLHQRIAQRFSNMLSLGLVDEVRQLRQRYPLSANSTSMRCVGYRQCWAYLDGKYDATTMRDKGIAATRQLAKRQLTWQRQFREHWQDFQELDCLNEQLETHLCEAVLKKIASLR